MQTRFLLLSCLFAINSVCFGQNIGINSQGAAPHSSAMLDVSSTTSGFLMPRMTTAERNAIVAPAVGLQVFNTTTGKENTYNGINWTEVGRQNYVLVKSAADLPAPVSGAITLDGNTVYEINGTIDISPNYINCNGAKIKGMFAGKDIIKSNVAGAILRSTDQNVSIESLTISIASSSTSGINFSDATGTRVCNLSPNIVIVNTVSPSQGVGQVSGFRLILFMQNYWRCSSGLKLDGNMGRIVYAFNYTTDFTNGSILEFLPGLNAQVVDISNNQFNNSASASIINSGATIANGRLTACMFSGAGTSISGFSQKDVNWWMSNNNAIADSRVLGQLHIATAANNASVAVNTFQVVAGTYGADPNNERISQTTDQLNYLNSRSAVVNVVASLSVNALANTSGEVLEFEIRKNGQSLTESRQKVAIKGTTDFVNLMLTDIITLQPNDIIEVWGRNTTSTAAWRVEKMIVSIR